MEYIASYLSSSTVCLNMIVKNESKIIERLMTSVLPIISCYCICDTGSTDNTVEVIQEFFSARGIPGKILHEPFKNFCHNRNVALMGCVGMSDFVLLLDADMILEVKEFNKGILATGDNFYILQGTEAFHYQNVRIIRNNGKYRYVGVTHEYIDVPPGSRYISLPRDTIFINDVGDGGCKGDKCERDIRLLAEDLKTDPNNARSHFYLANSYRDSGRYDEAITHYKTRISLGGWKEEVWYSHYRVGDCHRRAGRMGDAIYAWLDAFNFYPDRLENMYEIVHHYRMQTQNRVGYEMYRIAKEVLDKGLNRTSYLFLENDVYTYKLLIEFTIMAYYIGVRNIDNELVTILNNAPAGCGEVNNLLSNAKFYRQVLQRTDVRVMDHSCAQEVGGEMVPFTSSSSCIVPDDIGYLMNVRYVNYAITPTGAYLGCDKHIITVNRCVHLDKELKPDGVDTWGTVSYDGRRYMGIEDVRIFPGEGGLWFIGTGYHASEQIGVVYGHYSPECTIQEVVEARPNFVKTGCEKNWVFIPSTTPTAEVPKVVYSWHPLKICVLNGDELVIESTRPMPRILSYVRGSSCGFLYTSLVGILGEGGTGGDDRLSLVEMRREIWFVSHIVSYESPGHYYHIISVFDTDMNLLRYSAPFEFEGEPIEYCLSIVVEPTRVLINYSTWDRTTRIGVYDKAYIDGLLRFT